jgi:hypothetical protein
MHLSGSLADWLTGNHFASEPFLRLMKAKLKLRLTAFTLFLPIIILTLMNFASAEKNSSEMETRTITRIWRGWTAKDKADEFERTLTTVAIPAIEKNKPNGCLGIQVLRRDLQDEVEFTTIMLFNSIDAIKEFAGEDYESAHIDSEVKPLLLRYDVRVAHHQTLFSRTW